MVRRNLLVALLFGVGMLCMVGCQETVAKGDFDALKKHNENLMSENQQLRTEYETAKNTPAPAPEIAVAPSNLDSVRAQLPPGTSISERDGKPVIRVEGGLVNYGSGKSGLSPEGKSAMDKVALILNRDFAGRAIVIEGHTDSDPINRTKNLYKSNWELGMKRATEVVDYLTIKGVDPKRISATSFADNRPISQDKSKNRRVEIVVLPTDASSFPTPTATGPTMTK
jgi:flagellar motor protein MotB